MSEQSDFERGWDAFHSGELRGPESSAEWRRGWDAALEVWIEDEECDEHHR